MTMEPQGTRNWFWGLVAIAVAVPVALVVESLLRALILPPDFEYLREAWGPGITPLVWVLVPISMAVDVAAYFLQLALQKRAAEMAAAEVSKKRWKKFEGLMISASVAQIPGFIAAFCFMLGASLPSVLAVVTVSTVGVVGLGVTLNRDPG